MPALYSTSRRSRSPIWSKGAACTLMTLFSCLSVCKAQWDDYYPDGGEFTPEYRAATVVTNLWIGIFAVLSTVFGILGKWLNAAIMHFQGRQLKVWCLAGMIVATQWPNPRICCYKTSFSDLPSRVSRGCCSLYSLNVGFGIFWTLVFAIMAVARDIPRLVACLCFSLMHALVIFTFRAKFKRHGRPDYPSDTHTVRGADELCEVVRSITAAMGIELQEASACISQQNK